MHTVTLTCTQYKGRPFYIPSPLGERLMIPGKYVEELKTAPVDEVDFVGTFFEASKALIIHPLEVSTECR